MKPNDVSSNSHPVAELNNVWLCVALLGAHNKYTNVLLTCKCLKFPFGEDSVGQTQDPKKN